MVHDADELSDALMHAFARETRLSETSFVQSATAAPTTATGSSRWAARSRSPAIRRSAPPWRSRGPAASRAATYVQRTQPGEQAIDVELDGLRASVSMLQEPPQLGVELDPDDVLGLVGLDGSEADPRLPCQVVSTGVPQVIACVRDAAALRRVLPDYDRIGRLLAEHDAITLYLAAVDPEAGHGARPLLHALGGDGRGPGDRLGGRPAVRPRRRAHRARSGSRSSRGSRWAARAGWSPRWTAIASAWAARR